LLQKTINSQLHMIHEINTSEYPYDFSPFEVYIYAPECGIGRRTRHEADGSCDRDYKAGSPVD